MTRHIGFALIVLAVIASTQPLDARSKKSGKKLEDPPACPATFDDSPETNGIWMPGKSTGVEQPQVMHQEEAELTDAMRMGYHNGTIKQSKFVSLISFIVDKQGKTTDICVKSGAGYGLDAQAAEAVRHYRFEPAKKDGQPVAVRLTSEISFRLY